MGRTKWSLEADGRAPTEARESAKQEAVRVGIAEAYIAPLFLWLARSEERVSRLASSSLRAKVCRATGAEGESISLEGLLAEALYWESGGMWGRTRT